MHPVDNEESLKHFIEKNRSVIVIFSSESNILCKFISMTDCFSSGNENNSFILLELHRIITKSEDSKLLQQEKFMILNQALQS